MPYLLGFQIENKNVLAIDDQNLFIGTDDPGDALKMLPDYRGDHAKGYTQSMSACIHWMQFSPRLFFFNDLDAIDKALLDKKIWNGGSIAGRIKYTHLQDNYEPNVAHVAKLIA